MTNPSTPNTPGEQSGASGEIRSTTPKSRSKLTLALVGVAVLAVVGVGIWKLTELGAVEPETSTSPSPPAMSVRPPGMRLPLASSGPQAQQVAPPSNDPRTKACDRFLGDADQGKWDPANAEALGATAPLAQRIAMVALEGPDLATASSALPCGDIPSRAPSAWKTFVRAAGQSTKAWSAPQAVSDPLLAALASSPEPLSPEAQASLRTYVEATVNRALKVIKGKSLAQVQKECSESGAVSPTSPNACPLVQGGRSCRIAAMTRMAASCPSCAKLQTWLEKASK